MKRFERDWRTFGPHYSGWAIIARRAWWERQGLIQASKEQQP